MRTEVIREDGFSFTRIFRPFDPEYVQRELRMGNPVLVKRGDEDKLIVLLAFDAESKRYVTIGGSYLGSYLEGAETVANIAEVTETEREERA